MKIEYIYYIDKMCDIEPDAYQFYCDIIRSFEQQGHLFALQALRTPFARERIMTMYICRLEAKSVCQFIVSEWLINTPEFVYEIREKYKQIVLDELMKKIYLLVSKDRKKIIRGNSI